MQRLGVSQKIKLSNNTHTHTTSWIHTNAKSISPWFTNNNFFTKKHCILRWKALHSLHGKIFPAVLELCTGLPVSRLGLHYRKVLKALQNLVNAFFYCYFFLIADFASFWMLQNYFMLCYLFLIADFASFWMLQNYFMLALLLIFNCRFYA